MWLGKPGVCGLDQTDVKAHSHARLQGCGADLKPGKPSPIGEIPHHVAVLTYCPGKDLHRCYGSANICANISHHARGKTRLMSAYETVMEHQQAQFAPSTK
mmetsp:Transcript_11625/g.27877  ORF Transcript_11625/g.27877 Transcript_11625/m.27877 type:complete len:101 (+) Transcript_11625:183-485(+)